MPWTQADAKRHTAKAKTAAQRKMWAQVANAALASGKTDGEAVRAANSAIKHAAAHKAARKSFQKAARGTVLE